MEWYVELGIDREKLRLRAHDADELVALLDRHQRRRVPVSRSAGRSWRASPTAATSTCASTRSSRGEKLEYVDPQTKERYLPHVIEPAAGVGRTILALLCDAYDEDEQGGEQRTVLRLHPKIAPVKVAVLPLLRKDGHPELAREVYEGLRGAHDRRVRRRRAHRQALPPPGRDRHPVRRHDRPPVASKITQ